MIISLAEAFMLRNDLKKKITELTESCSSNLWTEKSITIPFGVGGKVHPKDALIKTEILMNQLLLLNIEITKANIANTELLRELETVSAKIALYTQIKSAYASYPGERVRNRSVYDSTGPEFLEYILLGNFGYVDSSLEESILRKREIEKTLAKNNSRITLEVVSE